MQQSQLVSGASFKVSSLPVSSEDLSQQGRVPQAESKNKRKPELQRGNIFVPKVDIRFDLSEHRA